MTIFFDARRSRWSYDFRKAGQRYRGYCLDAHGAPVKSRAAALQAEGVERRRIELEPKIAKAGEMTLAMATAALTAEWQLQANFAERRRWAKEILNWFGPDSAIAAIDQARVDDYIAWCRTRRTLAWHGGPKLDPRDPRHARFWVTTEAVRSAATVNLYLGTLRRILARAGAHRDAHTGRPVFEHIPAVREIRRPKRKARPMPDVVAAEIMAIMPEHVVDAMWLTEWFGFRRGEAFSLERSQIDWENSGVRLYAENVKDAEDVFLPASQHAMGYLWCLDIEAGRRGQRALITWRRIFRDGTEEYRPIKNPRGAWRRARELMIERHGRTWRWHDLRAAFITHIAVTSGGVVAQTLARHSDLKTTQAYIDVTDELRRTAVDRIADRPGLRAGESHRQNSPTAKLAVVGKTAK